MWGILVIVVFWEAKGELSKEEIPKHFDVLKSTMRQQHVTILEMVICPKLVSQEWNGAFIWSLYTTVKGETTTYDYPLFIALFTNNNSTLQYITEKRQKKTKLHK